VRVIAGTLRGRKLISPEGQGTRPTSDKLRESLFNILTHQLEVGFSGLRVADIFAGTGALGIEAISRGALSCTFIEKHAGPTSAIFKNLRDLDLEDVTKLQRVSASALPHRKKGFDLILMDPPYSMGLADVGLKSIVDSNWCNKGSIIVVESHVSDAIKIPEELTEINNRKYGKTKIQILKFGLTSTE